MVAQRQAWTLVLGIVVAVGLAGCGDEPVPEPRAYQQPASDCERAIRYIATLERFLDDAVVAQYAHRGEPRYGIMVQANRHDLGVAMRQPLRVCHSRDDLETAWDAACGYGLDTCAAMAVPEDVDTVFPVGYCDHFDFYRRTAVCRTVPTD